MSREGSSGDLLSEHQYTHGIHSERYKTSVSEAIRKIQHLE